MAKSWKDRLTSILLEKKLISEKNLEKALKLHKEKGGSLGEMLTKEGFVTQKDFMITLSKELKMPPINLQKFTIDPAVIQLVPANVAKKYSIIPISKLGDALMVAMSDPMNIMAIDDLQTLTNYKIDPVLCTKTQIVKAIEEYYKLEKKQFSEALQQIEAKEGAASLELVREETLDLAKAEAESTAAPIVKMVELIITEALGKRASDIHIEPQEKEVRIRYRVDGELQEAYSLPKKNQNAVLTRFKIMSGLNITESRIPQDGRFKIIYGAKEIDFRVSVLPITHGGKVVLRTLDKSNLSTGIEKLGFSEGALKQFNAAIEKPYGMILVTGPTGSGKSTTLYSIINKFNTPEKNIVSIENPVEYQIEGITQVQVRPEIELTFGKGLKAILRQSPDIIMVGEIRDFETADTAIKAALTGQLLLSTLHTNDAPSAVTRLVDMGVEPFLVSSSVIGICAQRLCRQLCNSCKEKYEVPVEKMKEDGIEPIETSADGSGIFYNAKGCSRCSNTGYHGRVAIIEFMTVDDKIKSMIIEEASSDAIKEYATGQGMKTLRQDGFLKAAEGITTLEEVYRVTSEE